MIKRTTTLYVMILASILQATMSLISLASFARFFWQDSAAIAAIYTVQQRGAWAVAALWLIASLVAGIAMLRRRTWARKLYAVGGVVALLAWFALLPWPLVVAAVVPVAATIRALYSHSANLHLHAIPADAPKGRRTLIAQVLFAAATALIYSTYLGMFLGHGWMYEQFGGYAPLYHLIAWVVVLVAAILVAPRGTRAWQCGVALMVFVVALTAALIGFIPYTAVSARYLGTAFQPFEVQWGPAAFGVAVIAFVAWLLLSLAKMRGGPKEPPPPHGDLPDFA
ncbi:hypothetical protein [Paraburkholderia terricola]|uniref:hypothetical protein n=1 Tax=Paraburkholderia terricola TaxID=169427 RepID=UPI003ECFBADD